MNPLTVETKAATYQAAVLSLYVEMPDTPLRASLADHALARRFQERGVPLPLVETALLLASLRRFARPTDQPRLPPIRSLAYFLPVVEELLETPAPNLYLEYLRLKLQRLGQHVDLEKRCHPLG